MYLQGSIEIFLKNETRGHGCKNSSGQGKYGLCSTSWGGKLPNQVLSSTGSKKCLPESHVTTPKNMLLDIANEVLIDLTNEIPQVQKLNGIQPQNSSDLGEPIGAEDLNSSSDRKEHLNMLNTNNATTGVFEVGQKCSGEQGVTALLEALCTPVPTEENWMEYLISYAHILELIEQEDSNMILRNEAAFQVVGNGDEFLKILQECSESVSDVFRSES